MRKLVVQVLGAAAIGRVLVLGGNPGTLTRASLTFGVLADSSTTGFLHCNESLTTGGQTGNRLLAGMVHTQSFLQTPAGPGPLPQSLPLFVFTSATAGVGSFTSTVLTQTVQTAIFTITFYSTYVGREVSWMWHAPLPSLSPMGVALLGRSVFATAVGGLDM